MTYPDSFIKQSYQPYTSPRNSLPSYSTDPLVRGDRTRKGVPGQSGPFPDEAAIEISLISGACEQAFLFVLGRRREGIDIHCGAHLKVVNASAES